MAAAHPASVDVPAAADGPLAGQLAAMFGGAPPPPLPPPPHGRLGRRRAPAAVPAAGSAEAAAPSLSADASFGRGGLVKLATLEAAYRSGEPGLQLQAVELFGQLFEEQPFPTVINAGFLKLADWFRTTSNNLVRYHIFRVFERSHAHLRKLLTADEVVKSISYVLESTEPLARALALRTLGCVGFTMAERVNIQQNIIKRLKSPSCGQLELEAAIHGAEKICAVSETFGKALLGSGILEKITTGPSVPLSIKILTVNIYKYMHSSPEAAAKAKSLCLELLHRQQEPQYRVAILRTTSRLAARALTGLGSQVGLLMATATGGDIFPVKLEAIRSLRTLVRHCTDQISAAHVEMLLNLFQSAHLQYKTAHRRRSAFQLALLKLLTEVFAQGFGPSIFVETVLGVRGGYAKRRPAVSKPCDIDGETAVEDDAASQSDVAKKVNLLLDAMDQCERLIVPAPAVDRAGSVPLAVRLPGGDQPAIGAGQKVPFGCRGFTSTSTPSGKHSGGPFQRRPQRHGVDYVAVYSARFLVQLLAIWKSPTVVKAFGKEEYADRLRAYFDGFPSSFARSILSAVSRGWPVTSFDGCPDASLAQCHIRGLLDCLIATAATMKWMPVGGYPHDSRVNQYAFFVSEVGRELMQLAQAPTRSSDEGQSLVLKCLVRLAVMHPLRAHGSSIEQDDAEFEWSSAEASRENHSGKLPAGVFRLRMLLCSASALPAVSERQDREAFVSYFKNAVAKVSSITGWSIYVLARDAARYGWWELCLWLLDNDLRSMASSEETGLWLATLESASRAESILVDAATQPNGSIGKRANLSHAGISEALLAARHHVSKSCGFLNALASISPGGTWRFQRWYLQLRAEFLEISRTALAHLSLLSQSSGRGRWKLRACAERYRNLEKRYYFFSRRFFGLDYDSNRALDSLRLVALVLSYVIGRVACHGKQYEGDTDLDISIGPLTTILNEHAYSLEAVLRDTDFWTRDVFPGRKDATAASPLWGYAIHVLGHFQRKFDTDEMNVAQDMVDLAVAIRQAFQIPLPAPAALFNQGLSTVSVLLATIPRPENGQPIRIQRGKLLKVTVEGVFDAEHAPGRGNRAPIEEVEVSYFISSVSGPSADSIDDQIASEDDAAYWADVAEPAGASADVEMSSGADSDEEEEDEDVSRVTRMQLARKATASVPRGAWRTERKAKHVRADGCYFRAECKFQTAVSENRGSAADPLYVRISCAVVDGSRGNSVCPVEELSVPLVLT